MEGAVKNEALVGEQRERITELEAEITRLEAIVASLEAEGLQPLVDRMRSQIITIRKLVVAMATAIDELTQHQ